ncbi:MAG: hypothetical protein VYE58_06410 [Pseudomonadota bacterium]|nr:hypothetical protein [Pseudomonadota bacterium]
MANAAEGASASVLSAQYETALARYLPLQRHSAYFEVCIGASLTDCGYFAARLFSLPKFLEMSDDHIQSAMRAVRAFRGGEYQRTAIFTRMRLR